MNKSNFILPLFFKVSDFQLLLYIRITKRDFEIQIPQASFLEIWPLFKSVYF